MSKMHFHYIVPGDDFTRAGEASSSVKKKLKQLGYDPDATRRVAIAMYEGEINMVIHAGGGEIDVDVSPAQVDVVMADQGPGIADVEKAMQEGYSTAPDMIWAFPSLTRMASVGQRLMQLVQPKHLSLSRVTE